MKRITKMQIRGSDTWGNGAYGAPRGDHTHHGVDLVCEKGDVIVSSVSGVVAKIGYPYPPEGSKGHYRYVEIKDSDGRRHRIFYITPIVKVGQAVAPGVAIGIVQGLQEAYPGITDHVHYEIKVGGNTYIDPTPQVI